MPQIQICSLGHRWDPATDQRPDPHARWNLCPECGQGVELFSLRDTTPSAHTPGPGVGDNGLVATPTAAEPALPGYEILSLLGYGGMGVVYKARHAASDRLVALKVVAAGPQARPGDLIRFRTENQAISRVSHPHIVRVWEVGEHAGVPFAALEYMDRGNLRQAIAGNPLPPRVAAELLALLSDAVERAHHAGIIHRDLKPANVLLATPADGDPLAAASPAVRLLGVPKVSDFGLAKQIDGTGANTRTGAVMGTPSYMAPEQAEGRTKYVGPATDIYSLGAILYECLTGRPPFLGETVMETLDQVRYEEPVPPRQVRPDVPRDLETICLKCLRKSPADRYGRAQDLADDLRRYLAGQPIQARRPPFWWPWAQLAGRHPALVGLALALLVVGLLLAQRMLWGGGQPPDPPSPETETAYFAAVGRRWGALEGLRRLSPEEAARRQRSFRFTLRGGLVERVDAVDWRGRPTTNHTVRTYLDRLPSGSIDRVNPAAGPLPVGPLASLVAPQEATVPESRACTWEYQRDEKGRVQRERARDAANRVLWTFQVSRATERGATGFYTDERGYPRARTSSGATHVELTYDDDGLPSETRYRSGTGKPRPDNEGIFGRRFRPDDHGLPRSESFLDPEDKPMLHPGGFARVDRTWNAQGDLLETAYFDGQGKPVQAFFPFFSLAKSRTAHDADGNPTRRETLDLDGKVTNLSVMEYDGRGHLRFEENRTPAAAPGGEEKPVVRNGYARREYGYDGDGNCTRLANFDAERKPLRIRGLGCEALGPHYDKYGRVTEVDFFDAAGNPAPPFRDPLRFRLRGDEVKVKLRYNDRGQVVEKTAVGPDGAPALDAWGAARTTYEYNDDGRLTEEALFDRDGKPTRGTIRFAKRKLEYRAGHLVGVTYYDTDGRPLALEPRPGAEGLLELVMLGSPEASRDPLAAKLTLKHDDWGNITEAKLLNADDSPKADATGVAEVRTRYDDLGALSELATFDVAGRPIAKPDGVARTTWTVDELGNVTEVATYDAANRLVVPKAPPVDPPDGPTGPMRVTGVARHVRKFVGYNLVGEWFYDAANKPTLGNLGYCRATFEYGPDGMGQSSMYYDLAGNPVVTKAVAQRQVWLTPGTAIPDLVARDVLLKYDGRVVDCAWEFLEWKEQEPLGATKVLVVQRAGVPVELTIPTGPAPRRSGGPFAGLRRETALLLLLTPGNLQVSPFIGTWASDKLP